MTTVGTNPALTPAQQLQLTQAQTSLGMAPSGVATSTVDFSQMLAGFDEGGEDAEGSGGGSDDGGLAGALSSLGSVDPNTMHTLYGSKAVKAVDKTPGALHIGEPKAMISKPISGGGPVGAATGVQALGSTGTMDSLMSELVKILRELTNILAAQVNGASGAPSTDSSGGGAPAPAPSKSEPPMKMPPQKQPIGIDPIPATPIIDPPPASVDVPPPSVDAPPASVDTPPASADTPPAATPTPSADPSGDLSMPTLVNGEGAGDIPPAPPGA